jgi:hypothetical protein
MQGRSADRPYDRSVFPRITALARPRAAFLVAVVLLATLAVGCSGASFEPSGPCTSDGRAAGAYPELEALVPATFRGRPPDRLDSGRNCTAQALATLVAHGVTELRFAGGTWDLGSSSGVTLAVFEATVLDPSWLAEFYEVGARTARNTESVESRAVIVPNGSPGTRIDALNGESYQSVIVWQDGDQVRVALIASFIRQTQTKEAHDAVVTEALQAANAR